MRITTRALPALPAVLASALLLTACGSQGADSPGGEEKDGVRITGAGPSPASVEFAVTNHETKPFTYTVTFEAVSASGAVSAHEKQTVSSVAPGQTARRTVRMEAVGPDAHGAKRVRIAKVRRVPSDEAPAATGPCPPSGARITADDGDDAMGLRVVGLHLKNCGTRTFHLNGHPLLELLDEGRKPVSGIRILHGSGGIATVTGFDAPPRPVDLKPGETGSARLMWRNTTGTSAPVSAPYVRVRTEPGSQPVTVTPELDLGTTGKLGVSAWEKDPKR